VRPSRGHQERRLTRRRLECNPTVWEFAGFIANGERVIDDWTVVESYRSDMMQYGQPPGFWGQDGSPDQVHGLVDHDEDLGEVNVDYWLDVRRLTECASPLHEPATSRCPRQSCRGYPGPDQIEVIWTRQASDPSWISTEQCRAVLAGQRGRTHSGRSGCVGRPRRLLTGGRRAPPVSLPVSVPHRPAPSLASHQLPE
jgi:hypothetical protein